MANMGVPCGGHCRRRGVCRQINRGGSAVCVKQSSQRIDVHPALLAKAKKGKPMQYHALTSRDQELVQAAIDVISNNFRDERHTVGAAVLCSSGEIYAGVNVESCGYGPCAEPIAIG